MRLSFRHHRLMFVILGLSPSWAPLRSVAQDATTTTTTEAACCARCMHTCAQFQTPQHPVDTSISVGAVGQLTATRIDSSSTDFVAQSLSPSAGVFATFQQSFKSWLGYSVNFGYTRATYRYAATPATFGGALNVTYIPNNVYETSASYIARRKMTGRLTVFGEAGGGAMAFAAITRSIGYPLGYYLNVERSNVFRPVGIAGVGADYRLAHGLALRAEYRGLFFRYPDYGSGLPGFSTLTSEPTASITYTFGGQGKR